MFHLLPNLVLEEVLGKYERELKQKCQKAFSAGRDALHYLINEDNPDSEFRLLVDTSRQVQAFHDRLLNPAAGIKVIVFDDSKLDVREAVPKPPPKINWLGGAELVLGGATKLSTLAMLRGPQEPQEESLKATYKGQVSMRIINGKVESPDFDTFEFEK